MATKIIPEDKDIPIEYTQKLILPGTDYESRANYWIWNGNYGGRSFAYIGKCLH